ncbi:hypothetical protein P4S68_05225 [Pseudoalteromonas sp. Hal099]
MESWSDILADPTRFEREYSVIGGQADSVQSGESNVFLTMGTNDRAFFSQGIQFDGDWQVAAFGLLSTHSHLGCVFIKM